MGLWPYRVGNVLRKSQKREQKDTKLDFSLSGPVENPIQRDSGCDRSMNRKQAYNFVDWFDRVNKWSTRLRTPTSLEERKTFSVVIGAARKANLNSISIKSRISQQFSIIRHSKVIPLKWT